MLKNSNSKILIMIKLYNYLSRQRRAYFFFSLNFVSQRMRKEKKISRIRCLKIGLLGRKIGFYEAHPNCSFLYSFFPALAIRGANFSRYYRAGRASIRVLSASRFLLRLSPNRTRSRSLCARVSPGRRRFFSAFPGEKWFEMTNSPRVRSASKPRDISRNCLRGSGIVSRPATRQRKYSPLEIYSKIDLLLAAFFLSREKLFALSN